MNGLDAFDLLPEAVLLLDADRVVRHANDRAADLLGVTAGDVGAAFGEAVVLVTTDGTVCADPAPPNPVAQRVAARSWVVRLGDGRERRVVSAGRHLADGSVVLSFRPASPRPLARPGVAHLVAQLAHEVRTPLASLRGFTGLLAARWQDLPAETRGTMVEGIAAAAEHMSAMLDELLDVSRLEVDAMRVATEPVDVVALAEAVVTAARARPAARGRDLVVVAEDPPARVPADPRRLRQILANLVENALVHAPGAAVEVRVGRHGGDGVVVSVADDGPGVPSERRDDVFTMFGRLGDDAASGTGLGLYVARGLARAHGGDLVLAAIAGAGATFVLTLPGSDG